MSERGTRKSPGGMRSLIWVGLLRTVLYMVVIGFFLQYIYFGERGMFYRPGEAVLKLVIALLFNQALLLLGDRNHWLDQIIALTCVIDLVVLTWVILSSGGFNSVLIPYYLPVLVMAAAWVPRRFTAVFPSIATLGIAYIGVAHLQVSMGNLQPLSDLYPQEVLNSLRYSLPHTIVSTMLIFSVLFFVISYISGVLSDRLFIEQRLNVEVLSNMTEGVAVVSLKGALVYVNAEFERLFPEARLGKDFTLVGDLLLGRDGEGPSLAQLLSLDLSEMLTFNRENYRDGDGPPIEVRVSGISMRGGHELYALVFVVTDLSMRRRMEKAERNVERFSAISTMSAGLAHEIRNPLASLRSAIQEIGHSFPSDSPNRMLTDVVIAESDRLDGIIGRFLDFSREGRLRLERRRIGALLEDMCTMLRHREEAAGVELALDIREAPELLCDGDRLAEVFFNLGLNSVQEMQKGGGRLEIYLGLAGRDGIPGVEILFMDNGPGIRDDELQQIFEPFFSNKARGTGMGLPLSRKQIAMHGGEIEASNRDPHGACFRIWLPLEAQIREGRRGFTRDIRRSISK